MSGTDDDVITVKRLLGHNDLCFRVRDADYQQGDPATESTVTLHRAWWVQDGVPSERLSPLELNEVNGDTHYKTRREIVDAYEEYMRDQE